MFDTGPCRTGWKRRSADCRPGRPVEAKFSQQCQVVLRGHAEGDDFDTQAMRGTAQATQELLVAGIAGNVLNVAWMHLDVVEAETRQLVAFGKTLAEILDADPATQLLERPRQIAERIERPERAIFTVQVAAGIDRFA